MDAAGLALAVLVFFCGADALLCLKVLPPLPASPLRRGACRRC